MGENDTAALDPIFFFHHCFIDYTFWIWQRRQGTTQGFTIDMQDPGASYANNQPPAGGNQGDMLTMATPLVPFEREDGSYFVSSDCVDIEGQLGYCYGPGSLDALATPAKAELLLAAGEPTKQVKVSGIDRSKIAGSFVIAAYAEDADGVHRLVGADAVLSRWSVTGCANCQTRLRAGSQFQVAAERASGGVQVVVHTRNGPIGNVPQAFKSAGQLRAMATQVDVPFKVEII
jgi:tyrosinase